MKKKEKRTPYEELSVKVAVMWTRVSTDKQEKDNCSLETQYKDITEFAKACNIRIKKEFGGEHESAASEGKLFSEMIDYVLKDKEVNIILVWMYGRFSRTGAKGIVIKDELKEKGKYVIAVKELVNPDTPIGQFTEDLKFIFNKFENAQRAATCTAGMRTCVSNGYWYSKPPFGYSKKKIEKGKHSVWVNEDGKKLRDAWIWKIEGISEVEICKKLNARGLDIDRKHLCKILHNRFYCGYINHSLLDEEIKGKQEVLIDERTWNLANGRYESGKYEHTATNENYPLKHHIVCSCCGKHLTGYEVKSRGRLYYKCSTIGCCCNESLDKMHSSYIQLLDSCSIPEQMVPILSIVIHKYFEERNQSEIEVRTILLKRRTEQENKAKTLKIRYGLGEINKDVYDTTIEHLNTELASINSELEEAEIDISNIEKYTEEVLAFVCKLGSCWDNGSFQTRQKIQNLVFPTGVLWDKENKCYRTENMNEAIKIINAISATYKDEKEEATTDFALLSPQVGMRRLERPTPTSRT